MIDLQWASRWQSSQMPTDKNTVLGIKNISFKRNILRILQLLPSCHSVGTFQPSHPFQWENFWAYFFSQQLIKYFENRKHMFENNRLHPNLALLSVLLQKIGCYFFLPAAVFILVVKRQICKTRTKFVIQSSVSILLKLL